MTHHHGFARVGEAELNPKFEKEILANGGRIFRGTHALSSAEKAIRKQQGPLEPLELIAYKLRLMGGRNESVR